MAEADIDKNLRFFARFSAYYGLWTGYFNRCEPVPMREMAELFLREATARPNCPEALAHRISGVTRFYFGDFAGAHDHFQKSIQLHDQARHGDFANRFRQDPRSTAEAYDAVALWVLGGVDEGLCLAERALADAESAAHPPALAQALLYAALLGLVGCNREAVATSSQALADIASRYDLPAAWHGFAVFQHRRRTPPLNWLKVLSPFTNSPLKWGPDRHRLGPHRATILNA